MQDKEAGLLRELDEKTTREILIDHERRLFTMEQAQKELADNLKSMREDSAEMLKVFKEVAPVVKKCLYFLAAVGGVYLLGGDVSILEKVVKVATAIGGIGG